MQRQRRKARHVGAADAGCTEWNPPMQADTFAEIKAVFAEVCGLTEPALTERLRALTSDADVSAEVRADRRAVDAYRSFCAAARSAVECGGERGSENRRCAGAVETGR